MTPDTHDENMLMGVNEVEIYTLLPSLLCFFIVMSISLCQGALEDICKSRFLCSLNLVNVMGISKV